MLAGRSECDQRKLRKSARSADVSEVHGQRSLLARLIIAEIEDDTQQQ